MDKSNDFDDNCLFCKIVKKEIKSDIVYEDQNVLVFKDIHPVAPIHVLLIPKRHIESINFIDDSNISYINDIFKVIPEIVKKLGIHDKGYRIIANTGDDGGQLIHHLHFHLIGGKHLGPKIVED